MVLCYDLILMLIKYTSYTNCIWSLLSDQAHGSIILVPEKMRPGKIRSPCINFVGSLVVQERIRMGE